MDTTSSLSGDHPKWTLFRSDAGRWWATRTKPFHPAAEQADVYRTVDADDQEALQALIKQQEERAELANPER